MFEKMGGEANDLLVTAGKLMLSGAYNQSIEMYEKLIEMNPKDNGDYFLSVGAAHYFKQDYDKAIEFYLLAREASCDEEMVDDNIWESCETLFEANNSNESLERYLKLCPDGAHKKIS